jgi:uncharacterized membrane protein
MSLEESPRATRGLWTAWAVLGAATVAIVWWWNQDGGEGQLAALLALSMSGLVLGKLLIFSGIHENVVLGPWEIALLSTLVDLHVAFALALGIRHLERVPKIGAWMRRMRTRTSQTLREYPGLRRMAFFGLVAFVFLPIAYTGPITASFAARLMGLSRTMGVVGIAVGSVLASAAFAALAVALGARGEELLKNPVLAVVGLAAAVGLGWWAWRRVRRELQRR